MAMNKLFSRWLPGVTLAIWSAILLHFYFSGKVHDFLAPDFRPGVLVAGLVLGLMALVFSVFPADASCCSAADCGHSLSRVASGKVLTFLILLLPITTAATFSPEGYSANVLKNRGIITDAASLGGGPRPLAPQAAPELPLPSNAPPAPATPAIDAKVSQPPPPSDYLQRTPEGYIIAEVLDLLYAAQDETLRKDFEGKTVQLVGQLMPDTTNNASGHRFKAVRMFMTCCAADARPVAALVEGKEAPGLAEMAWIKITGTATFPIEGGRRIAVLRADRVEAASPPEESMLY